MATHTLTTSAALTCVAYSQSPITLLPADVATVGDLIRDDQSVAHPFVGSFDHRGILSIPNRFGALRMLPGDVLAVDQNGWPILVSAYSIATGGWTFT